MHCKIIFNPQIEYQHIASPNVRYCSLYKIDPDVILHCKTDDNQIYKDTMLKKILSMVVTLVCAIPAIAQRPLPLNPEVRHGVLPNGLSYYILHNEKPRGRANFYIAQKVGSALETPEQYGLAHFLEHMAFNGTRHFPGDSIFALS